MARYSAGKPIGRGHPRPAPCGHITFLLILACALVATMACGPRAAAHRSAPASTPLPTPTATSVDLPSFSDWRAAYLGADDKLHAVTLDGKLDLAGPPLSGMTMNGLNLATAGFSPDGSLLAYVGAGGLKVVGTHQANVNRVPNVAAYELYWSPDSSQLAIGDGLDGFSVVRIDDGHLSVMPSGGAAAPQGVTDIVGWTDNTHVAVRLIPTTPSKGDFATTESLGVVDITTWQVRVVASVSSPTLNFPTFVVSPDGAYALCFNRRFRADPFTPLADLIDIKTGVVTPLPRIAALLSAGFGFTGVAWKPGTQTVMASNGYGNGGLWLLDLRQDTAVKQPVDAQSGVMYAAGWAPDGAHVVFSSGWQAGTNLGPYELDAATVGPQGITATTVLTTNAMSFPFLGFVHTA